MPTAPHTADAMADAWEMALIHRILRHGFEEVTHLVEGVTPGSTARSRAVAEHLRFTLDGLHNHHSTEDELLWPALRERAHMPPAVIDRMEAQHATLHQGIERVQLLLGPWERGPGPDTSAALAEALRDVITELAEHLAEEERDIVPLIPRHVTQQEWDHLGKRAFAKFKPAQRFTAMGEMLEVATPDEASKMLKGLPAPILLIWRIAGKRKYDRYMARVRG